jgi:16S rRNA (guanine527-N7)-methyltransferase
MLGLKDTEAIHGRIQDKEILQSMTGRFDAVISRAFSDLQTLRLLAFPFLKKGGILLAMKGELDEEEIGHLSKREDTRYRLQGTVSFFLPKSSFKRSILLFEKG